MINSGKISPICVVLGLILIGTTSSIRRQYYYKDKAEVRINLNFCNRMTHRNTRGASSKCCSLSLFVELDYA